MNYNTLWKFDVTSRGAPIACTCLKSLSHSWIGLHALLHCDAIPVLWLWRMCVYAQCAWTSTIATQRKYAAYKQATSRPTADCHMRIQLTLPKGTIDACQSKFWYKTPFLYWESIVLSTEPHVQLLNFSLCSHYEVYIVLTTGCHIHPGFATFGPMSCTR